jgi:hypothetical protein
MLKFEGEVEARIRRSCRALGGEERTWRWRLKERKKFRLWMERDQYVLEGQVRVEGVVEVACGGCGRTNRC